MVPTSLQGVLWSKRVQHLDLERDDQYIIHQILGYGSLDDISWLIKTYGLEKVKDVFVSKPLKIYSRSAFNFAVKMILDLPFGELILEKYDQTTLRRAG